MKKKAQSISINTIVVAAIALVVMILIVMIFTNSFAGFNRSANACESSGAECVEECVSEGPILRKIRNDLVCYGPDGNPDKDKVCCQVVG